MENVHERTEGMAKIFKVLSSLDAIKIFFLAERGIDNSTHAMDMLDLTQKKYYTRLKELSETELIKKINGVHRLTALGKIIYDYFIPAMAKACEAKKELTILELLKGTSIENKIKGMFEDEFNILGLAESPKLRIIDNYENFSIEAIDLYDSAEESVILASNYFDVRVMEATFRAVDRGVINRIIIGKRSLSSKIQNFKLMLSMTFTKTIMNFASNTVDLKEFVRFIDLPYTFCVVDGYRNLIEISNNLDESFMIALSIDDRRISEKLTDFYETLWKEGEFHTALNIRARAAGLIRDHGYDGSSPPMIPSFFSK